MESTRLGERGPVVSRVGIGTMSVLAEGDRTAAARLVHAALDAGLTLIDTADVYGDGAVEEFLGDALRGRRDEVVLATKVGLPMNADPGRAGGSAKWIRQAVEDSLRRLRTDRIDLYQLHRPDPTTPVAETVEVFGQLVQEGKVRYPGHSVFPAELIVEAQWAAERAGVPAPVSDQPPYSILVRGVERAVLPTARSHGLGIIAWGPLNGGWLTGKYRRGVPAPADSRAARGNPFVKADDEVKLDVVERLGRVAREAGLTMLQLGMSWPLQHPAITSVLIGPRTQDQLDELIAAASMTIEPAVLDAVDEIVPPGVDVDPRNAGWTPGGLAMTERRRMASGVG
ncbi:MAG: aldo/keto reductase [Microbacterium sp.]|uniref:aldo/keto reductase n=1 Tax=Microbacterium sp. TaxID=51671 RepID=UPI00271ADE52|nr:aldo/keto reductase [Microbacterium sp.]MDO8383027.1 aldo/keto reductase [Microbacterium sp.]